MGKGSKSQGQVHGDGQGRSTLGELIHERVREAIEAAVDEELAAALGASRSERGQGRRGYRNGTRERTLTGPTGPLALSVPRGLLFDRPGGRREWQSALVPRYQRRMAEVNEAIVATYLTGANTRRLRGALQPLLKGAPLSKSAVSRVIGTLKAGLEAWLKRSLHDDAVVYLYLDAVALRVRSAGKVVSVPILAAVGVLADGQKRLLRLEMCGAESRSAWHGFIEAMVHQGLRAPVLCIIDGNAGLRSAIATTWPKAAVQRCLVHKLRNLEAKVPKHALEAMREDFRQIMYAESAAEGDKAYQAFEKKWKSRCPGVVTSLHEAGDELLTFYRFPQGQWKTLRTTNVIERLNGEFRRRVKTQSSLPTEEAALSLLFGLVATGQVVLRRLDGWKQIPIVLRQQETRAA